MRKENLRLRDHSPEELCFYSKGTTDIEFLFPFGWGELWGIADRTDYDLTQHQNTSGESMEFFDAETNEKYIPTVIESSQGLERLFLAILCDAYHTETLPDGDTRVVLKLQPNLAPYQICVLPLQKKGLTETATKLYRDLQQQFNVTYDDAGSIGKRYRRQDEIGTPLCITVDYDTLEDQAVTIRHRDTMAQERVKIADLPTKVIDIFTAYNNKKNIL